MSHRKTIAGLPIAKVAEIMQVSPSTPRRWLSMQKPLLLEWAKERQRRVQLEQIARQSPDFRPGKDSAAAEGRPTE